MYLIWLNYIFIFILTLDIIGYSDTVTTVTGTILGVFYLNQVYTDVVHICITVTTTTVITNDISISYVWSTLQ